LDSLEDVLPPRVVRFFVILGRVLVGDSLHRSRGTLGVFDGSFRGFDEFAERGGGLDVQLGELQANPWPGLLQAHVDNFGREAMNPTAVLENEGARRTLGHATSTGNERATLGELIVEQCP
jgi:hypothetical protein